MEAVLIIGVFIMVVIITIAISNSSKQAKSGTDGATTKAPDNELKVLLDINIEIEKVELESIALISSMLDDSGRYSAEDVAFLQSHKANSTKSLEVARSNKASFEGMVPDGHTVLRVENFSAFRDSMHAQLVNALGMQCAIRNKFLSHKKYDFAEEMLYEKANSNYEFIQTCIATLDLSHHTESNRLNEKANEYIELFLIDLAAADDDISEKEVELLNRVFKQEKSSEDYKENYLKQIGKDQVATQVVSLIKLLGNLSEGTAHYVNISFHELVLNMIAIDGSEDERELNKLSNYFDLLNKEFGIETQPQNIQSAGSENTAEKSVDLDAESHSLDDLLAELGELIGLASVKHEVNNLCNLVRVNEMRAQANLPTSKMSLHLVFTGNPGTGKTTVARLLARIFNALGLLSKGHFVEVGRSGLVGGYVGQTAIKTKELIDRSMGGILFIDEAYSLARDNSDADYGKEAIETLLKAMEDHRENLIVIVAGYPDEMAQFINSNPGLKSRFSKYIHFPDYDEVELMEIMQKIIAESSYNLTKDAEVIFQKVIKQLYDNKTEHFGNARTVRNLFEHVIQQHSNRIITINNPSTEELQIIKEEDVACFLEKDVTEEVEIA